MKKGIKIAIIVSSISLVLAGGLTSYFVVLNNSRGTAIENIEEIEVKKTEIEEINDIYNAESLKEISERDYSKVLKPYQMASMTYDLLDKKENWSIECTGSTLAFGSLKQDIYSLQIKNGINGYEYAESTGTINTFSKHYETENGVLIYKSSSKDGFTSDVSDSMTIDKYVEVIGRKVTEPNIYVVSNETVLGETVTPVSGEGATKVVKDADGYTIDLETDAVKASVKMIKHMKYFGDLSDYPKYIYCHLRIKTNNNLEIISMESYEKYSVIYGIFPAELTSYMKNVYKTENVENIPSKP